MTRLHAPLPEETEHVISSIIDAGIQVHRELGPGFLELVYRNALCFELQTRRIPFEIERAFIVKYREQPIAVQKVDLVVDARVIVELKAALCLDQLHLAQLLSYLRATGMRAGLLMNFGGLTLRAGLRRVVI